MHLAGIKLPWILRSPRQADQIANYGSINPTRKDQAFDTLRREIFFARLKINLDDQLNRETSRTVKRLAGMNLPPIDRSVK
ncbi:hypothetical protein ACT3UD_14175 [Glutamicibacter sp. 287]|uniref:hypothetical protein n=1 Tax=unclassified Glutamicibacter TaxID=2627139 RepID=UPI0040341F54